MAEPTAPSPEEVLRAAEFRTALRRFERQSDRIARASGLTPRRYLILLLIKGAADRSERSTVTELAKRMSLAQSTVTELVARTEDAGLVQRESSPEDGRVAKLAVTKEGERRLTEAFRSLAAERRSLREAIGRLAD
jgi:DNA-binding MarR family transcriptional regulator